MLRAPVDSRLLLAPEGTTLSLKLNEGVCLYVCIYVPGHKCYVRATEEFNRKYCNYLTNILHCNLFEPLYLELRPNRSSV